MQPATLQSANTIPMLRTLGIRLCEIGEDFAVMEVTVDERHANYFGGVHGGLIATLADTVCFFPRPLLPAGRLVTTANLNVNYLKAPTLGDRLIARSKIEHLGRRTVSLTFRISTDADSCIAHGTASLIVLQQPATD
jgi:acyl-CoA thioesterase